MRKDNVKTQNMQIPSLGRAAETTNTFHADLSEFFNADDASGHVGTVTILCAAFTRSTISDFATTTQIADMVYAVNMIQEFIVNVERAYLYGDRDLMTEQQASAIGDLLSPIGSKSLVYLLRMSLQDWILDSQNYEYYDDFKDESIPQFWAIQDLINACYAIYQHVTNHELSEGGLSWQK